jgi:hypothetical protein
MGVGDGAGGRGRPSEAIDAQTSGIRPRPVHRPTRTSRSRQADASCAPANGGGGAAARALEESPANGEGVAAARALEEMQWGIAVVTCETGLALCVGFQPSRWMGGDWTDKIDPPGLFRVISPTL